MSKKKIWVIGGFLVAVVIAALSIFLIHRSLTSEKEKVLASYPNGSWQVSSLCGDAAVNDKNLQELKFIGYHQQGKIYLKTDENVQDLSFSINGNTVDAKTVNKNPGKVVEIPISNWTIDGKDNQFKLNSITPQDAAVEVKIPYPEVIDQTKEKTLDQNTVDLLDRLVQGQIDEGFSAAQLAVIKDGAMVLNKAWGNVNGYTSDAFDENGKVIKASEINKSSAKVTKDTLFDLASNTKMYATNYAIQKLVTDGVIDINQTVNTYIPEFRDQASDEIKGKDTLKIRDVLQHQAGFPADPQYDNNHSSYIQKHPELYSQNRDEILSKIILTPLSYQPGTQTKYSDVDYMLLGFLVEKVTGQRLDEYLNQNIYQPLGLTHTVFNPLQNGFKEQNCAATELDGNTRTGTVSFNNVRTSLIQGQVHDEKAFYSMGGVSGHAGLFSNASELAQLCQLMLNGGGYGMHSFFSQEVIDEFTAPKSDAEPEWGLGWWRRADSASRIAYFGPQSSPETFGHQGWTGTLTVIDPQRHMVVVLLTNKKNSPVIDPQGDSNDFVCDNYTLGTLGNVVSLVNEAADHHGDRSVDADICTMVLNKLKMLSGHKGKADEKTHFSDAAALIKTLVKQLEAKKTEFLHTQSNTMLQLFLDCLKNSGLDAQTQQSYEKEIQGLQGKVQKMKNLKEEKTDAKLSLKSVNAIPGNASDYSSVAFPSRFEEMQTKNILNSGLYTISQKDMQNTLYLAITNPEASKNLLIFINGQEVDTSAVKESKPGTYQLDISDVAKGDRNTVQINALQPGIDNTSVYLFTAVK